MDRSEIELRTHMAALEHQYKVLKLGLLWGWLPFFLIAFYVLGLVFFEGDTERYYLVGVLFFTLMVTFIVYYGFLFNRMFKIGAELSKTKARIEIESGLGRDDKSNT